MLNFKNLKLRLFKIFFLHLFMCVNAYMCMPKHTEVKGQFLGSGSFLIPFG